jgi:hypothetical protein
MNPFCAKNLKTNYNVVPYGDHGTERARARRIAQCLQYFFLIFKVWHAGK